MNELLVKRNDVTLCTESFGRRTDPAILLIMGATASMLWWDKKFCQQLANKSFFVIRYDNRDVGQSTTYPPGPPPYDLVDMVDDAVGILDAYEIQQAHLFGMSLGGLIGQIAALKYSDRVLSLILLGTGPFGPTSPDIPEMDERILTFQANASQIDWTDEDAVAAYLITGAELLSGSQRPYDQQRGEALARSEFRRANQLISMFNHAQLQGGEAYYGRVAEITQPILIIHGTDDKIWHINHALYMETAFNNTQLLLLEGAGHELHEQDWATIIKTVEQHIKSIG